MNQKTKCTEQNSTSSRRKLVNKNESLYYLGVEKELLTMIQNSDATIKINNNKFNYIKQPTRKNQKTNGKGGGCDIYHG